MRKRPARIAPQPPVLAPLAALAPRPAGMTPEIARAVNLATWYAERHKPRKDS